MGGSIVNNFFRSIAEIEAKVQELQTTLDLSERECKRMKDKLAEMGVNPITLLQMAQKQD